MSALALCARVLKFHFVILYREYKKECQNPIIISWVRFYVIISIKFDSSMTRLWTPKFARMLLCHALFGFKHDCIQSYLTNYVASTIIAICIAIYFGFEGAANDMKIASLELSIVKRHAKLKCGLIQGSLSHKYSGR